VGAVAFGGPASLTHSIFERYDPEAWSMWGPSLLFRHGRSAAGAGIRISVAHDMNAAAPLVLGMNESCSLSATSSTAPGTTTSIAAPTQAGVICALEALSQLADFFLPGSSRWRGRVSHSMRLDH
jgi:hypothetical protein